MENYISDGALVKVKYRDLGRGLVGGIGEPPPPNAMLGPKVLSKEIVVNNSVSIHFGAPLYHEIVINIVATIINAKRGIQFYRA